MTVNLVICILNDIRETGTHLGTYLRMFLERINCREKSAFNLGVSILWVGKKERQLSAVSRSVLV